MDAKDAYDIVANWNEKPDPDLSPDNTFMSHINYKADFENSKLTSFYFSLKILQG